MQRQLRPGGWERSPFLLQLLLWLHTRSLAQAAAPGKRGPRRRGAASVSSPAYLLAGRFGLGMRRRGKEPFWPLSFASAPAALRLGAARLGDGEVGCVACVCVQKAPDCERNFSLHRRAGRGQPAPLQSAGKRVRIRHSPILGSLTGEEAPRS